MGPSTSQDRYVIGVDFGGTKIRAGVFDSSLECLGWSKTSTKAERGPAAVIDRLARCIRDAADECDLDLARVEAVGLGVPGAVDPGSGTVLFAPNLGWKGLPLRDELARRLGVTVRLQNDCNAAILGIYEKELRRSAAQVVGIFIGTGIGAGLILDGRLYTGFNRSAGEIGHMVLDIGGPVCSCGNRGCFEALASRRAIFREIQTAVQRGRQTVLTALLGPDLEDLRSGHLRKAIRYGDKLVQKIVLKAARSTGIAVGNVLNLFNPQVVVLGGGLIEALEEHMLPTIRETALAGALPGTTAGVQILASRLGDDAGMVGGAVVARLNNA